jgi:F-type H+-transporting ATPase subunit gamma
MTTNQRRGHFGRSSSAWCSNADFSALLENGASEQGARMSAMDNATRNAGDMIDKLTIQYNRSRQAVITNELIEIISGAEAL